VSHYYNELISSHRN